jgi:hypothetical protein
VKGNSDVKAFAKDITKHLESIEAHSKTRLKIRDINMMHIMTQYIKYG